MIRQLRLYSGLVMLAYVAMHLLNHAVGLISLRAMDEVLRYVVRIWSNYPAQTLLYGSFLVHYGLVAMGTVGAAKPAAACFRTEPDCSWLRDPDPTRAPRRRYSNRQ